MQWWGMLPGRTAVCYSWSFQCSAAGHLCWLELSTKFRLFFWPATRLRTLNPNPTWTICEGTAVEGSGLGLKLRWAGEEQKDELATVLGMVSGQCRWFFLCHKLDFLCPTLTQCLRYVTGKAVFCYGWLFIALFSYFFERHFYLKIKHAF